MNMAFEFRGMQHEGCYPLIPWDNPINLWIDYFLITQAEIKLKEMLDESDVK